MARVGRLAGALIAESGAEFFLVGTARRSCDWAAVGFVPPREVDASSTPYVRLVRAGALALSGPWLSIAMEGEKLARMLATRFLLERNGGVSDGLWRLVMRDRPDGDDPAPDAVVDGRWLIDVPPHVWELVRERSFQCR